MKETSTRELKDFKKNQGLHSHVKREQKKKKEKDDGNVAQFFISHDSTLHTISTQIDEGKCMPLNA
jgi:hypothetical protein